MLGGSQNLDPAKSLRDQTKIVLNRPRGTASNVRACSSSVACATLADFARLDPSAYAALAALVLDGGARQ